MTRARSRVAKQRAPQAQGPGTAHTPAGSRAPLAFPLGMALLLAAFVTLPQVQSEAPLPATILVVAALLGAWTAVLWVASPARKLTLGASARKQHWLQACAHLSIYLYWGYHWRTVYDSATSSRRRWYLPMPSTRC